VCREVPDVAERVLHARIAIAVTLVDRLIDRNRPGLESALRLPISSTETAGAGSRKFLDQLEQTGAMLDFGETGLARGIVLRDLAQLYRLELSRAFAAIRDRMGRDAKQPCCEWRPRHSQRGRFLSAR
jgi:hypothetical protein